MFRLAVKFFPPDPGQLQEEYTRSVPVQFSFPPLLLWLGVYEIVDVLIGCIKLELKKKV